MPIHNTLEVSEICPYCGCGGRYHDGTGCTFHLDCAYTGQDEDDAIIVDSMAITMGDEDYAPELEAELYEADDVVEDLTDEEFADDVDLDAFFGHE